HQHGLAAGRRAGYHPEEGDEALAGIVGVDPLEAAVLVVAGMQRGHRGVRAIEMTDPLLHATMVLVVQSLPLDARLVVPLGPLRQLTAHEQELLAGHGPLVPV